MQDTYNYTSPETIKVIVDSVEKLNLRKWEDQDVQMLFKIMYHSALRPSEAIRLEKRHFDLERREIFLGKTKTKLGDKAAIPKSFVPELYQWLVTKEEGRLWPELQYRTFYNWLDKLGAICHILAWQTPQNESHEKTKGHIFRKSFGKDMIAGTFGERAKDINIIAQHMRHKKPSTTMDHYLKLTLEGVKDAI